MDMLLTCVQNFCYHIRIPPNQTKNMESKTLILKCWGPYACFSQPISRVERFTYPLPNPSAIRGIFSAVYSKPVEFWWQPVKVEVLNPVQYIALRRNEVKDKTPIPTPKKMTEGGEVFPIVADADSALLGNDQKGRTQRQTMALKDVAYRLHAKIIPQPGFAGQLPAFEAQFERRAGKGKNFVQPSLGQREFAAYYELVDDLASVQSAEPAVESFSRDLGLMVYDVFDLSVQNPSGEGKPFISLFKAVVKNGIMEIPPFGSADVIKPERKI